MKRTFAPPSFDDPEKTRLSEFLNVVSLVLLVILGFLLLLNLFYVTGLGSKVNPVLAGLILCQVSTQILIRRGKVHLAGLSLLFLSWLGITWFAFLVDGVHDVVLFAYITILLGAGYMFGWEAFLLFAAASVFAIWFLAFYEIQGSIRPALASPARIALYLTALFILISFQIFYILNTLKKALADSTYENQARKQIENELREQQEKLNFALDAANMGTWSWEIGKETVELSEKFKKYVGVQQEGTNGQYSQYTSMIHPDDLERVQSTIRRAFAGEVAPYHVEHRILLPGGEVHWVESRGNVHRDAAGQPVRMAGTVVDITQRKEAEAEREHLLAELAAKNAELERFVYTVSHDLKSPLVTIVGFLGYLEKDFQTGNLDALHKDMDRIYRAAARMQELLQDLLDLSRIGRMMNKPEVVPFDTLVREALELIDGRLRERGVQVIVEPGLPSVCGDAKRLLELVQNLIDNAAKYMGDQTHPRIEIGSRGFENGKPVFYIRDNGMGIAPEHHERIFGLFNKLDPNVEGTGVGLTLVKRIVEYHEGRIWIESELGRGTTFFFTLPAEESKL